jgi:hypothetical protein
VTVTRTARPTVARLGALLVAWAVAWAVAVTPLAPAHGAVPADLRLNQIQVLGTHNSYHVQPGPSLLSVLRLFSAPLADSLEYTHPPLSEQLDAEGIRQFELDVFTDPDGGLYATPAGPGVVALLGLPPDLPPSDPYGLMRHAGLKVFHVQDIDIRSRCLKLLKCLRTVKLWSDAHPQHVPVMIQLELKDDPIPDPGIGFVVPRQFGPVDLDKVDRKVRAVFSEDELLTPDDVRGTHATLEEAVLTDGWPRLDDVRGKVLFTLDNEGEEKTLYLDGHPSLAGRVLFTSSRPGAPEAAFVKLNDSIADGALIRDLVARGYIIRTRADADTVQARTGDTTAREAALSSGAQFVSTDYPVPDPDFGTGYFVALPGGGPARCNPVNAPPSCPVGDLEQLGP